MKACAIKRDIARESDVVELRESSSSLLRRQVLEVIELMVEEELKAVL